MTANSLSEQATYFHPPLKPNSLSNIFRTWGASAPSYQTLRTQIIFFISLLVECGLLPYALRNKISIFAGPCEPY